MEDEKANNLSTVLREKLRIQPEEMEFIQIQERSKEDDNGNKTRPKCNVEP